MRACRIRVLRLAQPLLPGRQAHAHRDLRRDRHRFGLASPRLTGEREGIQQLLTAQPARRPRRGTAIVADKGFSGDDFEEFLASLGLDLTRPARKDDKKPRHFPNWPRQRAEAIIGTLQSQLGLERHGGRVPAGLRARVVQRLLALNAVIWHNSMTGAPVKRSLIACDHRTS